MDILGDLELFEELAELGSFSAVARRRGQAPSSVSRRLDRLEAHLDQRLFNRAPTGLFLTATGARKLAEAHALTKAAAAFGETREARGELTGHVVVSAPSRLGTVAVAPVVADFLIENPNASIDLHLTDAFLDLDRKRIDLAIRIGGTVPDHYLIRRIASNVRILIATPDYLASHGPFDTVESLDASHGLMLGNTPVWTLTSTEGRIHVAKPKARLRCVSGDAVMRFCEAGLGIALKSAWDAAPLLDAGALVRVLPGWKQEELSDIMMILPDRRLISPTLRALEQRLAEDLGKLTRIALD
ncbi:LysR family transcriptional regulator [Thalassococcus sp. S3]|uniref:LysR family transcriptional regulator n=1 Tax=Thalassococcus sp. S3 TaxID=2017482 RepID=UPI0010243A75|nr:LysR family transcriptional regulator [Thalassococcus sp. S3]QBF33953.1 hypothetical protein CFI11_22495 [Thalassococcus sp. S3]